MASTDPKIQAATIRAAIRRREAELAAATDPGTVQRIEGNIHRLRANLAEIEAEIPAEKPRKPRKEKPTETTEPDRPTVVVSGGRMEKPTAEAWQAIEKSNRKNPRLFIFGGIPSRVEGQAENPSVCPLTLDKAKHELARRASFYTVTREGDAAECQPPLWLVRDLLAEPDPPLPTLKRIARAPFVSRSGKIIHRQGFDPETGTLLTVSVDLTIPENPGQKDAALAAEWLARELFSDFPFSGDADRAHALALLLTPFTRELFDRTPLFVIDAATPGTGKGKLATVALTPGTGGHFSTITEGRDDDEYRKRITAILRDTVPAFVIDNIARGIDAPALAALLTAETWTDRVLGKSENIRLAVNTLAVATGNNVSVSTEIGRRAVWCRIVADREKPWTREKFRHASLEEWERSNLSEIMNKIFTIISAWLDAGRPEFTGRVLGSFEAWARVIGGILTFAGIPGFLANADEILENADTEAEAWRALVIAWYERFTASPVTTAQIFGIVQDELPDFPLSGNNERAQKTALGKALGHHADRVYGRLKVCRAGTRHKTTVWALRSLEGGEGGERGGFSPSEIIEKESNYIRGAKTSPTSPTSPLPDDPPPF